MAKLARQYHKRLMLFLGLQFLIWSVTGLYMVSLDIHFIHGESLEQQKQQFSLKQVNYSVNELIAAYPNANDIEVTLLLGQPVYRFEEGNGKKLLNAATGQPIAQVDEKQARAIARYNVVDNLPIKSVSLISSVTNLPAEFAPRHLPAWQVTFKAFYAPTFYISQQTGEIVTKRHNYWRLFDWMWRFHIMDYDDGENVANWLLLFFSLCAAIASISGLILTYYRVVRPKVLKAK